jgi:hypothetical protein
LIELALAVRQAVISRAWAVVRFDDVSPRTDEHFVGSVEQVSWRS